MPVLVKIRCLDQILEGLSSGNILTKLALYRSKCNGKLHSSSHGKFTSV